MDSSNSPPDSQYAIWVGLGGHYDKENLWQVGTAWSSSLGYYAWIEAVGNNGTIGEEPIASVIHNDPMTVTVWFDSSGAYYEVTDNNPLIGFTMGGDAPTGFQSGKLSADWIDERPACQLSPLHLYKLADFQYSGWTSAYATPNRSGAESKPIGSFTHTRVWVENSYTDTTRLAWADYLGSNKGSGTDNFIDHWEGEGSSQCG